MHDILLYATFLAGLVPLSLYLLSKGKVYPKGALKSIAPFLWLTAIASLYEPLATIVMGVRSLYWFRVYNVLEFATLYYFYRTLLPREYKPLFLFFAGFFLAGVVSVLVYPNIGQLALESLYALFISTFVIIFSGLWLEDIFQRALIPSIWAEPAFYFVSSFVLYYASTFFFYLLSDLIFAAENIDYKGYWLLNIIAALILRLGLSVGVWSGKVK